MFETVQHAMNIVDSRERAGSCSCKRLRLERCPLVLGRAARTGYPATNLASNLSFQRVNPLLLPLPMTTFLISNSTTYPLFLHPVLLEPFIESSNTADPPVTTSTPLSVDFDTHCQASHISPIGALYYTPHSGERDIIRIEGVHSSPSSDIDKPIVLELVGSFSMLPTKCTLASWALQKACVESEAKRAKSERALLIGEQSLTQAPPSI
ncbi:hypothetical protein J1N35_022341 [Gossypium stocksii]|uniref:Uncharacterized protein n=1 Tax=Gossypium stocksii TaxID=47602 RepID=A0A9D3VFY2_9ROSI|nr:hypothetical protein J1N35_022341 [Gossypium stocksii]